MGMLKLSIDKCWPVRVMQIYDRESSEHFFLTTMSSQNSADTCEL